MTVNIFTRPWTVSVPMTEGGPIFEYACHEGNYAMGNMLHGAPSRQRERHERIGRDRGDVLLAALAAIGHRVRVHLASTACVDHSSLPVFASKARNRRSLVAPTNTRPPAVTVGPALPLPPVSCLPSGSASVRPSGLSHAISPVLALTATSRAHGGRWHGRFATVRPLASLSGAVNVKYGPGAVDAAAIVGLRRAFGAAAVVQPGLLPLDPADERRVVRVDEDEARSSDRRPRRPSSRRRCRPGTASCSSAARRPRGTANGVNGPAL